MKCNVFFKLADCNLIVLQQAVPPVPACDFEDSGQELSMEVLSMEVPGSLCTPSSFHKPRLRIIKSQCSSVKAVGSKECPYSWSEAEFVPDVVCVFVQLIDLAAVATLCHLFQHDGLSANPMCNF